MRLSDLSIRKPVFAWMLMGALLVFGTIGARRLGVSQMPDVDFPQVSASLTLEAWVNGERRQASPAKELVRPVEELVARVSEVMTLLPGDVVAVGAWRGAGPLEPGDRVEIRIEGIGSLRNPVVRAAAAGEASL